MERADSKVIGVSACWIMGIVMCIFLLPVIDRTPGSTGKRYKRSWLLKRFRYLVERFDPLLKEVLQRYREKVKGFDGKATLMYSGAVAIQVMAINAMEFTARIARIYAFLCVCSAITEVCWYYVACGAITGNTHDISRNNHKR